MESQDNVSTASPSDGGTIDVCVGTIYFQGPRFKAFAIASDRYRAAAGPIPFPIERGQHLRLRGEPGEYRGKPGLLATRESETRGR